MSRPRKNRSRIVLKLTSSVGDKSETKVEGVNVTEEMKKAANVLERVTMGQSFADAVAAQTVASTPLDAPQLNS